MPEISASKYLIMLGWCDAPHLDEKTKRELLESTPPHLRAARSRGIPVLGSGIVFDAPESLWLIDPFEVPPHWVRIGGMDFGWDHPWAIVDCAWDRDTDTFYVIRSAKKSNVTPKQSMVEYGDAWPFSWLPFAWPHDGLQHDKGSGEQLARQYQSAGFQMLSERATFPDGSNGVEAGVMQILERKRTGKFRVFRSAGDYAEEARLYHRKEGLIVKANDDVLCAARYAFMMRRYARRQPGPSRPLKINRSWRSA